ncbi:DUF5689 domain-containing protein [Dokdonia sp. PRO95]|uniref:DUF5689 domain-containing protein n=1 Tax=Dokdonia sp. PRO95 TaxID=1239415 RepID=UPI0012602CB0|nr:DUF5689 domain-containing protein [Dokdonia sp. PRO95]
MMKLIQKLSIAAMLVLAMSCVNDDEFTTPLLEITEPALDGEIITIAQLANLYEQAVLIEADNLGINATSQTDVTALRSTFRLDLSDTNRYVEGFVISSDASGNWFEEIIIQDAASNPTAGVRVLIDESPLYTYYEVGRKVFVKLGNATLDNQAIGGLWIGDSNGILTLGMTENLDKIPAPAQFSFMQRSSIIEEIVPLEVIIEDFSNELENIFVKLSDVQFIKEDVIDGSVTYAGEPLDEFDGERELVHCTTGQSTLVSTSTFANFKSILLPDGVGSISGVLTRNFFGDTYNLAINNPEAVIFEETDRCDPVEIDCGPASGMGENILFEEFFETQTNNDPIVGNGWTNYQQEGTQAWEAYRSTGQNASLGRSARIASAFSGDARTVSWLITPPIDFTSNTGETLRFRTSNSFADGSRLTILFSNDWDGDVTTIAASTWDVLAAADVVADNDFFGSWIDSGIVDLSCVTDTGYIGFKYNGSGNSNFDGTYELDEIEIKAN